MEVKDYFKEKIKQATSFSISYNDNMICVYLNNFKKIFCCNNEIVALMKAYFYLLFSKLLNKGDDYDK